MPIGRALMIHQKINVYRTETSIFVSPDDASCGDIILIDGYVTSSVGTPTGNVDVYDTNSNTVIFSATLSSGHYSGSFTGTSGNYKFVALYSGVVNQYAPSSSDGYSYTIQPVSTSLSLPSRNPDYVCSYANFDLYADITPTSATGNVSFQFLSGNGTSRNLGSASLVGGTATLNVDTSSISLLFSDGYISANYDGYSCFAKSKTPSGYSGRPVTFVQNDTTSIVSITAVGGTTFSKASNKTFNVIVSASMLPNPSIGTIMLKAYSSLSGTVTLLTGQVLSDGLAICVVPANTFTSTGTFYIEAYYTGDGTCYLSCNSPLGNLGYAVTVTS